jgi:hypothetical protein
MLSSEVYWAGQPDPPGPYVLNVATLKYSTIDTQNNIKVRKAAHANQFTGIGEGMLSGAVLELPSDTRGNTWVRERALPGYSSPPVIEWHVADGDYRSHLVTQRIQASKFVDVVQRLRSSGQPSPGVIDPVDTSRGSVVSILLDRDTIIRNPKYGPLDGASDDGARLTFLLSQDATGGRTVTWPLPSLQPPAQFRVDPAPNAVTVVQFIADPLTGRWQATGWSTPPPSRQTLTFAVPRLAPTSCGADQTIRFKGAMAGAECSVGLPASPAAGLIVTCYVSDTDAVKLRFCNPTSEAIATATATYSVRVFNP